jgi:cellulose synthase operon protein YhjU
VILGLLIVPLLPEPGQTGAVGRGVVVAGRGNEGGGPANSVLAPDQLEATLQAFYAGERGKMVSFPKTAPPGFDVVFLSVCSLSWDDLDFMHMRNASLLSRFDVLFKQFNTAATYSGPAVLRLLRGNCGQSPHRDLYEAQHQGCFVFRSLAEAGYKPAMLLNHDGHFDKFAEQLRQFGGLGVEPINNHGAPVAMHSFDGTPIYADYELLSGAWKQQTTAAGGSRIAMFYNTITLHDGNRVPGLKSQHSLDTYQPRIAKLFADFDHFISLVEASNRPTVIILIPEHGGALRGDAVQVSGLRELPTLAITNAPAAVKLVGFRPGGSLTSSPVMVDRPSSYLALTALLAGLMQTDPSAIGREQLESLVHDLPSSEWVAENEGTVLMQQDGRSYLRTPEGQWSEFIMRQ